MLFWSGAAHTLIRHTHNLGGQSEIALREAVVERHPRERFQIADKLPSWMVHSTQDCQRYFHEQRERSGADFFDVYLLHWLNQKNYEVCERYDEFAFLRELKAQGKVGKLGSPITTAPPS